MVLQDLLAGVDPQILRSEPSFDQSCPGLFGLVGVLHDGDQEPLGVEPLWVLGRDLSTIAASSAPVRAESTPH